MLFDLEKSLVTLELYSRAHSSQFKVNVLLFPAKFEQGSYDALTWRNPILFLFGR